MLRLAGVGLSFRLGDEQRANVRRCSAFRPPTFEHHIVCRLPTQHTGT